MFLRGAGAITVLLVALTGSAGEAWSQYYPAQRAYPPAPYRPLPPLADDDDIELFYERPALYGRVPPRAAQTPPAQYRRALPPADVEIYAEPPSPRHGRRFASDESDTYVPAPPPGYIYRDAPPPQTGHIYRDGPPAPRSYEPVEPNQRVVRPTPPAAVEQQPPYVQPPYAQPPQNVQPPAAAAVPPAPAEQQQDAYRPPLPVGTNQSTQQPNPPDATGTVRDPRNMMSALPPDYRPETGPKKELPVQFRRTMVDYRTKEPVGTIIVDTPSTYLYLVLGNGKAMRYGIGVGREGFTWSGVEKVTRMAEWPDWHPPEEMIERQPYLPRFMAGGEGNPMGARALYLGKTVYRIHGTNQPSTIGTFVSSGCIRLTNEDVADLYTRVKVGTRVKVLPGGKTPAQSASVPVAPQATQPNANPPASTLPPQYVR